MNDGLLRISEALALDRGDIIDIEEGAGTAATRLSKTGQICEGAKVYLGLPTMRLMRDYRAMLCERIGEDPQGPLFIRVRKGDHPVLYAQLMIRGARLAIKRRTA